MLQTPGNLTPSLPTESYFQELTGVTPFKLLGTGGDRVAIVFSACFAISTLIPGKTQLVVSVSPGPPQDTLFGINLTLGGPSIVLTFKDVGPLLANEWWIQSAALNVGVSAFVTRYRPPRRRFPYLGD